MPSSASHPRMYIFVPPVQRHPKATAQKTDFARIRAGGYRRPTLTDIGGVADRIAVGCAEDYPHS